jgi:flagellar basal body rod protein FlgF
VRSEIAPANQQGTITPLVSLVNAGQGNVKVPLGLIAMMGSAQDLTRAAEVLRDDGFWRVKLPDGREVRVLAISVQSDPQGGRLTLTCETVLEHTPK